LRLIEPYLQEAGIALTEAHRSALETLVNLLERWNRRINLTAVRGAQAIAARHILDSLMLERLPWPDSVREFVDVGSGAGLPGLVVALRHPGVRVTSVETVAKKITFQTEAARQMGLANFRPLRRDVFHLARAPEGRAAFDVMTARAFADLKTLLPLAAALLRPGGELWAYKGERAPEEERAVEPEVAGAFDPPRRTPYRFDALGVGGVILAYRKR
jgi:16S rRNA (guanine527-N7)-methyltransferase